MSGSLAGRCQGCGEPIDFPCVACLANVLDLLGVRTPVVPHGGECRCGGSFSHLQPVPREES